MATITVRKIDSSGNPDFTTTLSDLDAVTQIILTTIKLFMGEWWENLNEGTPLFQKILGVYGVTTQSVSTVLLARIMSVDYVTGTSNVSCAYKATSKSFTFSCDVQTKFGTVTVSYPETGTAAEILEIT
jgi:hypothetical protein